MRINPNLGGVANMEKSALELGYAMGELSST